VSEQPLPISFLSDYGYEDEFAGVCRGVMAGIAPGVALIDLTHGIPPGDIRRGAFALANAIPAIPAGIHVGVVDPGVGTTRRAVAVRAPRQERIFVGPDNGLLWPALERCGGALEAVDIGASKFRAESVSATFHGRDIFAPVAAHLSIGASLAEAGEALDPESLARPPVPEPIVARDHAVAHLLYVDRFGNAALDLDPTAFRTLAGESEEAEVQVGEHRLQARLGRTFGDVAPGQALLYEDSNGRLSLAVNRGSAAGNLGLGPDDRIVLRFASRGAH
jgi:S-adenosylmethionine hydrolase